MISIEYLKFSKYSFCLAVVLLLSNDLFAQRNEDDLSVDSTFLFMQDTAVFFNSKSKKDPLKAAMYSAVLPGLGQAYNNQHWKIPIIYGGGIVFAHLIRKNHKFYNQFRAASIAISQTAPVGTVNPFEVYAPGYYTDSSISRNLERYRRDRDYIMILAGAFYLLNIAEAHIAAHLKEFDINEELSVKIHPSFDSSHLFSRSAGLSFTVSF